MMLVMSDKPLLKFSLFSLSLAILGAIIDLALIFFVMPALCSITGSSSYCEFNAFGLAPMLFGILLLPLVAISLLSCTVHLFYKGNVSSKLKIIGVSIGVLIFIVPYAITFLYIARVETSDKNVKIEFQVRRQQECAALKARQINEPSLVVPINCM